MIGFLTTTETLAKVESGFSAAFANRGVPQYLTLGARPYGDQWFIPFGDDALTQPLYGNHVMTNFPEFTELIGLLGGMDARVDVDFPDPEL